MKEIKTAFLYLLLLLCLPLLMANLVVASTIYKTVDQEGNISYSDKLPADEMLMDSLEFEEIIPASDPQEKVDQRIKRMATTADRLKKDRLDREASRREEARLDILANQQRKPPLVVRQEHYTPWFPPHHRYYRNHRKPFIDVNIGRKKDDHYFNYRFRNQPERKRGHILTPSSKLLTPSSTKSHHR